MTDVPLIRTLHAKNVVIVKELHDGIHGEHITVLQLPSGQRLERVFASVPAQGPALLGRDVLLDELRTQLSGGGQLVLHGLPGVGKSALALALAYDPQVLDRFSGGVLWAALGPGANADSALSVWTTALGVDLSSEPTAVDRARRLSAYLEQQLGGKPFLLVVDDAWNIDDIAPFRVLAARGSALLITTRQSDLAWQLDEARVVRVPELDEAAAVDLLSRRRPEVLQLEGEALRALAQAVGQLPLALVLIEGSLARRADQARWLHATLQQLQSGSARLELQDTRPRPGTTAQSLTLQRVIELSVDALPDATAQSAFDDLGVFAAKPADFSRDATLAVWQAESDVGDSRLELLCGRGLLEATAEDRFTLHQVLAEVARARLPEPSEAGTRHFDFYYELARASLTDWRVLEVELPQVRQARNWVSAQSDRVNQLFDLTNPMTAYFRRRGIRTEDLDWQEHALDAARRSGRRRDEAALLVNLGDIHANAGEYTEALELFEQALPIAKEVGDRDGEGSINHLIGGVYFRRGELDKAERSWIEALAIREEVQDQIGMGDTLNSLGEVKSMRGDLEAAVRYYNQAVTIRQATGDKVGRADSLNSIGALYDERGDLDNALKCYSLALDIHRELGDRLQEARGLNLVGEAHRQQGNDEAALRAYDQSLAIARDSGYPQIEGIALHNIAAVRFQQGKPGEARRLWEESLEIRRRVEDRVGEAATLNNLAAVYRQQGDLDGARQSAERALKIAQGIGDRQGAANATHILSVLQLDALAGSILRRKKGWLERVIPWRK